MREQIPELADLAQEAEDWLQAVLSCDLPRHPRYRLRVSMLAQVLERLKEEVMALQAQPQGQPYRCPFCGAELDMPPPEEWERFRHQGGPCGGVPEWHEGPELDE
jgi:rubrerythrin